MKKLVGYIVAALLVLVPAVTFAAEKINLEDYATMNLKDTLASEDMKISYDGYTENDDQITIYLFRGLGCGYCRSFLTFLNGITEEYGKYFKLVSFETWNDAANSELLGAVSSFLEQPAEGVPFIIIGDQVFPGYASSYDDGIKSAITTLYNTKKEDRYDVFEKYNSYLVEKEKSERSTAAKPIIWNFIFVAIATVVIVCHNNATKKAVLDAVKSQNKKVEKEQLEKPSVVKPKKRK